MPSYYIKTYGCQMNVADSEKLRDVVRGMGYEEAAEAEQADLILINTCVVRQHAEDKAAWYITSAKGLKKTNPNLKIGICGCLVTEPGRDLKKQFPHVDFFIPPNSPGELAKQLKSSPLSSPPTAENSFPSPSSMERVPGSPPGGRAGVRMVTIMTGCDNYCSYCVVPYVRGRETSRPMGEVLAEVKSLLEQGVTDITLLGQNVNSYKFGLADLLRSIKEYYPLPLGEGGEFPGQRVRAVTVRFMTSHPKDMSDAIIEAVAELPYVAQDFHLPLQSGDNEILKKMNRGYTVEYFKERVGKIRSLTPKARISSDIIVGFPGESDSQFENSLRVIRDINFTQVNMFAYSGRPGTAAAKLPGQVPEEIKQARLQKLIEVNRNILETA
jgi:tRNA-2-methylthio-N6-dimethylallyladenosine synthase